MLLSSYAGRREASEIFRDASAGKFVGKTSVGILTNLPARNTRGGGSSSSLIVDSIEDSSKTVK